MINNDQLERLCLQWFRETGWGYVHGPEIAPKAVSSERADYRDVVLRDRLANAVSRLNPELSDSAVDEMVHAPVMLPNPSLTKNDRVLSRGIGVKFNDDDGREGDLRSQVTGSTVASIPQTERWKVNVLTPPQVIGAGASNYIGDALRHSQRNETESWQFAELRDSHLPQLLTGGFSISEAQMIQVAANVY